MTDTIESVVGTMCKKQGGQQSGMMDIMRDLQAHFGFISKEAIDQIAESLSVPRIEVEAFVSFYSFLSDKPKGKVVIRLSNDIIDRLHGFDRVAEAFSDELGIKLGETSEDGQFTLETTACIGMCDQAPAATINRVIVTDLNSDKAREIARHLKAGQPPATLVKRLGDGNNAHELVRSMVNNNIRKEGNVVFSPLHRGQAIRKAIAMSPHEVIRAVKAARLRGRGGAGFPCGMKWDFARAAEGDLKYVLCNADEGEPGTFKDRVILTELADRVFAGMTIAGYAIGASEGIMYLRGEYSYLQKYLEDTLEKRCADGLLGRNILGKEGFHFNIRIQMGAGAYICGEETALISSCEGKRGDPKNRPPFPAQKGYQGCPSNVNNVETLCCVTKILEEGPATFAENGNDQSAGTKLLSISGDCEMPGVYEIPLGTPLFEVLEMCGATHSIAVQVGGPSGQMIPPDQFGRKICFDDLATGGSIMTFGPDRNILEIVHAFMEFFVEESCGYCTPCRVGNVVLKELLERVMSNRGTPEDLAMMEKTGETMRSTSRCGLGQTSSNPIISTLKNFRSVYENLVEDHPSGFARSFDAKAAVAGSEAMIGRVSIHNHK